MLFKIFGIIWAGIGMVGWISSCVYMWNAGELGNYAANYQASETFLFRFIVYFFVFILPGLILIRMGRRTGVKT